MRSDRQDDSTAAVGLAYQPARRQPVSIRSALVPRASCEARTTASPPEGLPSTPTPIRDGGDGRDPSTPDRLGLPAAGSARGSCPNTLRFGQVSGHYPSCVIRATCRAESRKTDDDGSPCARGCCAHVLANRYGLDARDTHASRGFPSDGSGCSGITGIDFDVDSIPSRSG